MSDLIEGTVDQRIPFNIEPEFFDEYDSDTQTKLSDIWEFLKRQDIDFMISISYSLGIINLSFKSKSKAFKHIHEQLFTHYKVIHKSVGKEQILKIKI